MVSTIGSKFKSYRMPDMPKEGVIQYRCDLHPGAPATESQISALADARQELYVRDAIGCDLSRYGACYGNVSMRTGSWAAGLGRREFLVSCTATGGDSELSAARISRVTHYDHGKNYVIAQGPCAPSSESMTHGAIYDASLDVRAVVHGHAPILWQWLLDNGAPSTPPEVDYGTPEMAESARKLVQEGLKNPWRLPGVIVMAGHQDGVVGFGSSVKQAIDRFLAAYDAAA
jgi:ribulose-5-phosphate 4-epimerase/fuculose-1-phosphate aldolase